MPNNHPPGPLDVEGSHFFFFSHHVGHQLFFCVFCVFVCVFFSEKALKVRDGKHITTALFFVPVPHYSSRFHFRIENGAYSGLLPPPLSLLRSRSGVQDNERGNTSASHRRGYTLSTSDGKNPIADFRSWTPGSCSNPWKSGA